MRRPAGARVARGPRSDRQSPPVVCVCVCVCVCVSVLRASHFKVDLVLHAREVLPDLPLLVGDVHLAHGAHPVWG
jgi:hypothetical protein